MPHLLAAHCISGCDRVTTYFGIGKTIVCNVLKAGSNQKLLGRLDASVENVLEKKSKFMLACFGTRTCASMTEVQQNASNKK